MSVTPLSRQEVAQIKRLFREGWGERNTVRIIGRHEYTVRQVLRGKHRYNRERLINGQRPKRTLRIYQ